MFRNFTRRSYCALLRLNRSAKHTVNILAREASLSWTASFRNSVIIFFYLIQGLAPQAKAINKTIETKAPTEKHIVSFSIPPITPCNNRNDPADIIALIFSTLTTPFALLSIYYHTLHRLSIGQIQNPAIFLAGLCKEKMEWIK